MPRTGGETDKLGNKYELAWVIRYALYCIQDEHRSLTAEDIDTELNRGSEFTYTTADGTTVHQLKRQDGNNNYWSIKTLARLKIFEAAIKHVASNRQYHFVSLIPCGPLRELAERARKSSNIADFTKSWLTEELRSAWDELSDKAILGSAETAWTTLRGMWFEVHEEHDIVQVNSTLADLSLEGATGHLTALALGDILLDNLGKRLTRTEFLAGLKKHGIQLLGVNAQATASEQVQAVTKSWRNTILRELLQPPIDRKESSELLKALSVNRLGLIVGTAGGGKSAVLEQVVSTLEKTGTPVLAFRLDRLDAFTTTANLGQQLGINSSPAAALGLTSNGRDAYLVVDQLDAVSLSSGRMPENFNVVMDLIGEALSVSGVRVILACREFDVDNDHRIRSLAARPDISKVKVGPLSAEAIDSAVRDMEIDPGLLSASQRELLQIPLHLILLKTIATKKDALVFQSRGSLFGAFWEHKRQAAKARRDTVHFNDVISRIANAASERQTLSVPIEILDEDDLIEDAKVLVSEHVLARQGERIAFFHEAFFDYAFARQWVSRSESLVDFLRRDEQELFRRAQVRQILQHMHEREPSRFIEEVEAVLTSPDIRFHIKETVLALVSHLPQPTSEEAELILRIAKTKPSYEERLWQQLRQPQWFRRFYDDGAIATWLDSADQKQKERAVDIMASGTKNYGNIVAELLSARQKSPDYIKWLHWILRYADIHNNRQLFDLLIKSVRQGEFDETQHELWLLVHELAKYQPLWAIELLQARLIDHADPFALNNEGKVANLTSHEYGAAELVREAATSEPLAFIQTVIPYLCDVMAATASPNKYGMPLRDKHFSMRFADTEYVGNDLDDALFVSSTQALERLVKSGPDSVLPILESLAENPHEAAQFLLYKALSAGGATFAKWSADLLLEGERRLDCGYVSDSDWVAREVVEAIAPHLDDSTHQQLEDQFRDLRNQFEKRQSTGRSAFTFLSALDKSRLSSDGLRRLEEYRRKFGQETPQTPMGIRSGSIESPISIEAASKMTDKQWLKAMVKHSKDRTDYSNFTGGVDELAQVLRQQVANDPARFAQLALEMSTKLNPVYSDAILMGFGEATPPEDAGPIFEAIRHIASFGNASNDRWLGMALKHYYRQTPLDIVELVRDRLLQSSDPQDNSPVFVRNGEEGRRAEDLRMDGINTIRGSLAESLGDLLIYDTDGKRTELVRPHLATLASDPVLSVRSCVAHTLAASLRYARPDVLAAFEKLIDADDYLLAADLVQRLMLYIGNVNPEEIEPVIQRMLISKDDEAREAGGRLGAFAALEWNRTKLMAQALSADEHVRKGVAYTCAGRIDHTSNAELATSSLISLMNDKTDSVREAVAQVAPQLREHPLRPFAGLLNALIDSPTYNHATPQLLLTLQYAPDKVDDLVLKTAQRFLKVFGDDASDIRTAAAGDAHYVSELVVRGLAQAQDRTYRASLLDTLDLLLERGVYGINEAIAQSERV